MAFERMEREEGEDGGVLVRGHGWGVHRGKEGGRR